jgi:hypothetical protein
LDIQGPQDRQHPRPSGATCSSLQILHHVAAHSGMAGKLNLTQSRPTAMPTDQGGQLFDLHDLSGETGDELGRFGNSWLNNHLIARKFKQNSHPS